MAFLFWGLQMSKWLVFLCVLSLALSTTASANDTQWLERFLTANGGCKMLVFGGGAYNPAESVHSSWEITDGNLDTAKLFGKPVLKWSDDDVREALRVYRDCITKQTTPTFVPHPAQNWEREIPLIITTARGLDAQRKAQQQAKIDLERKRKAEEAAEAAAQAEKERKAERTEEGNSKPLRKPSRIVKPPRKRPPRKSMRLNRGLQSENRKLSPCR